MSLYFFFNDPATTQIYPLSLHDALPIWATREEAIGQADRSRCRDRTGRRGDFKARPRVAGLVSRRGMSTALAKRSEEHTSELQSHVNIVCRLLLEKKKKYK